MLCKWVKNIECPYNEVMDLKCACCLLSLLISLQAGYTADRWERAKSKTEDDFIDTGVLTIDPGAEVTIVSISGRGRIYKIHYHGWSYANSQVVSIVKDGKTLLMDNPNKVTSRFRGPGVWTAGKIYDDVNENYNFEIEFNPPMRYKSNFEVRVRNENTTNPTNCRCFVYFEREVV